MLIDARILDHQLEDGWHSEQVRQLVLLDQLERLLRVEPVSRQQHCLASAGNHVELVYAGAMGQWSKHQRSVVGRGSRHEVAKMVCNHESHLTMREHRGLRA